MTSKVNMRELFHGMQQEMTQKLNLLRKNVVHAPTKGDAVELSWIEFLATYLPNRYCVDTAFIVDNTGACSEQIDLVIYDQQYSPFVFCHAGVKYIPAESVYAIFEVKQTLNKRHIIYAGEKAQSVRALKRTSVPIVHAGGTYPPRPVFDIVAGIITTSSDWTPTFGRAFQKVTETLMPLQCLNIGCVLDGGSFLLKPDETFEISSSEEALIFFFIKLFTQLQNLGTVPAMNIDLYSQALDSI
ncbi:hypothetical protein SAMN05192551_10815 [Tindallia magadiensis]|uniref:DUF6602 domain-containing protein n=1 Tax=Tindallia magadiensis TaxID=69895 RepID=A0A1I3G6A8_9FIRM|nr:DUF6602 domain-containing protein [Tindallia magadiensis]SFI18701.1 hypothetical protein SAMN05192551_10815 [Tindallia magadiensis]